MKIQDIKVQYEEILYAINKTTTLPEQYEGH